MQGSGNVPVCASNTSRPGLLLGPRDQREGARRIAGPESTLELHCKLVINFAVRAWNAIGPVSNKGAVSCQSVREAWGDTSCSFFTYRATPRFDQ